MLNNFSFTIYEVFGYFLPGCILFLGLFLDGWVLFSRTSSFVIDSFPLKLTTSGLFVICAYVLGHVCQALGNFLFRNLEKSAYSLRKYEWLQKKAAHLASAVSGIPEDKLEPIWIYRILDEFAVQQSKESDREIFIYREGFYRGCSISLAFLSLSLLISSVTPIAIIQFSSTTLNIYRYQTILLALIVLAISLLFVFRYKRFIEYRISKAVLSALTLNHSTHEKSKTTALGGS